MWGSTPWERTFQKLLQELFDSGDWAMAAKLLKSPQEMVEALETVPSPRLISSAGREQ
jgi:hypothetical protein